MRAAFSASRAVVRSSSEVTGNMLVGEGHLGKGGLAGGDQVVVEDAVGCLLFGSAVLKGREVLVAPGGGHGVFETATWMSLEEVGDAQVTSQVDINAKREQLPPAS